MREEKKAAPAAVAGPPAVVGEKFQRAWVQLDQLPGTMMVGPEGRFGPVPASTSAWITTSDRERDRWLSNGEPMLEIWIAAAPKAEPAPTGEYPPLPDPDASTIGLGHVWTRHSMRAYVDADRALRAQAAPVAQGDALDVEIAALESSCAHLGRLIDELRPDAERYQYLRERDLDTIRQGGVFAGRTPDNVVLNGDDLDAAIDADRAMRAQVAPAAVAGPTPDGLLDDDGENRAVRMFLAAYGTPGLTVATMRRHMELAGWTQSPEWTTKPDAQGHLTKSGAQSWLRHLFALEASTPTTKAAPVAQGDALDGARLDLLDKAHAGCIRLDDRKGVTPQTPQYFYWGPHHEAKTARAAIDATRTKAKEGGA